MWARPGLSIRDRRLVTLTVLMQFGNEQTLKLHFGAAMKQKQLTDAEIDELIVHVAHYAGWPVGGGLEPDRPRVARRAGQGEAGEEDG